MISIDLMGKTALITGGGQGIGQAISTALHAAGASVVINYFPDADGANQRKAEQLVQSLGGRATTAAADVRDVTAIDLMMQQIADQHGGLDIVINNAGILRDQSIKNMTHQQWQDVIDTNLTGVFNISKAATACMRDGGRIISLSSVSAMLGTFGQANYVAAKSGIIGLTRVLSRELAKRQITANAIAPGVVMTDMAETIPKEHRDVMLKQVPLGRFADPVEIANVAVFLASDMASYITGQTLHVNGGWYA